jgi:hypothetical protein
MNLIRLWKTGRVRFIKEFIRMKGPNLKWILSVYKKVCIQFPFPVNEINPVIIFDKLKGSCPSMHWLLFSCINTLRDCVDDIDVKVGNSFQMTQTAGTILWFIGIIFFTNHFRRNINAWLFNLISLVMCNILNNRFRIFKILRTGRNFYSLLKYIRMKFYRYLFWCREQPWSCSKSCFNDH